MTQEAAKVTPMFPITLAPQGDVIPHAYVLLRHSQHCANCNTLHEWSETYSKTFLKSRLGTRQVINLRPVREAHDLQYNLPREIICRPVHRVPFCLECFDTVDLKHLPPPPAVDMQKILGTGSEASVTEGSGTGTIKKAPKAKPSIDDLMV